jgi:cathepsin L
MALAISTLLFLFFTVSSALDMSIFNHDDNHLSHDQSSWRSDDEVMSIYKWWLQKHGKAYNRLGEKAKRFEIFKNNLRFIDEHNSQNRTYKVGLTKFADLTNQEYRAMFLGTRSDPKRRLMKSKTRVKGTLTRLETSCQNLWIGEEKELSIRSKIKEVVV